MNQMLKMMMVKGAGSQAAVTLYDPDRSTKVSAYFFEISWSASSGATNYRIDVSTDNFSTFISGYNDKSLGSSATSTTIAGLSANTYYYVRVRAVGSGTSANSNTISLYTMFQPPYWYQTSAGFVSWYNTYGPPYPDYHRIIIDDAVDAIATYENPAGQNYQGFDIHYDHDSLHAKVYAQRDGIWETRNYCEYTWTRGVDY